MSGELGRIRAPGDVLFDKRFESFDLGLSESGGTRRSKGFRANEEEGDEGTEFTLAERIIRRSGGVKTDRVAYEGFEWPGIRKDERLPIPAEMFFSVGETETKKSHGEWILSFRDKMVADLGGNPDEGSGSRMKGLSGDRSSHRRAGDEVNQMLGDRPVSRRPIRPDLGVSGKVGKADFLSGLKPFFKPGFKRRVADPRHVFIITVGEDWKNHRFSTTFRRLAACL